MNTDVLDLEPEVYVQAKLPQNGMIYVEGGSSWMDIFHKDNTLDRFPTVKKFWNLKEAVESLPLDPEYFIVAFPDSDAGTAKRLWFTELSEAEGIPERLDIWRRCYSGYPRSIYRS